MLAGSSSDEPRRPSRVEMLLTGGGQPVDRAAKLTPGRPAQGLRRLLSFVWALLPALSLGYLAPIPIIQLSEPPDWTAALLVGLVVVPTIHAFAIRRRVFEPRSQDPAIVVALQARQRRDQARAIAARDVDLARELRIGRPDLPRQFDDGGLVDVNHVPVSVLMQQLGLPAAAAVNVIEVRDRIGGFSSAQEVIAYTDLSPALVDSVGERLLFLP
jgi:hypothetical protein